MRVGDTGFEHRESGAIVGAGRHPHAARRLLQAWPELERARDHQDGPGVRIELEEDRSLPEGGYALTGLRPSATGVPGLLVRGGPLSGVIQGVERLRREGADGARITSLAERFSAAPVSASPALPYRTLWTWDHSTDWLLDALGSQDTGAFNPYNRQPDGFLADYQRLVDHASELGINAITVYGLLRDSHGGVGSAQELCRYALERGVRIVAGVGINAYGGIYWEGDRPYNLATWLRADPSLRARSEEALGFRIEDYGELSFPRSDYLAVACPSREENVRFHEEGVRWLVEALDVGGVNFEAGDYAGCDCDGCRSARASTSYQAVIAEQYARLFDIVASSSQHIDRWNVYEVYTDNVLDEATRGTVAALPDLATYQYTVNRSYWPKVRKAVVRGTFGRLPHRQNALRTHVGSQWNRQRHAWVGPQLAEMVRIAVEAGMSGLSIFGEASAYHPPNELNYLAFARFTWDPELDWDRFAREEMHPRFGGIEAAGRFVDLLARLEAGGRAELASGRDEARSIGHGLALDVARRWRWLEERFDRRLYAFRDS